MGGAIPKEGGEEVMSRRKGLRSCVWEGARLGVGAGNAPPEWTRGLAPGSCSAVVSTRLGRTGWECRVVLAMGR